jgi:dTDP-4-amino-4,6-dideoxygalactose transaminase
MGDVDLPELNSELIWPNNFCLGEIQCALGVKLLDRVVELNQEKRHRALQFIDAFVDHPEIEFHREDSDRHNYHLLVARLAVGNRDDFIRLMAREHRIQCVVQYYPLYRYPFYKKLGFGSARCSNTDKFFDSMISFPFHHSLDDSQLDQIRSAAINVLSRVSAGN